MEDIKEIKINAEGKILGRIASRVASILMGKSNPHFEKNIALPTKVLIYNASKVKLSKNKEATKKYKRYSGYPGGLKITPFLKAKEKNPIFPLEKAISGMLPRNRLKKLRLKNLTIISDEETKNN